MLSRRTLFQTIAASMVFLSLSEGQAFSQFLFRPKEKRKPRYRENLFIENGKSLVAVSSGKDAEEMVERAVSLIGGFEKLALSGKTVLVKPNVVSGERNPATTNPEVLSAVVKLLYKNGAKKVYAGDMSALRTVSTRRNMSRNGILKAAEAAGAEVIIFEDFEWYAVPLSGTEHIKEAYVTEWIFRPDVIVNLPVVKTHRSASYSITLKNFIGCTHLRQRPYLVNPSAWEELVAEFNTAYTPELNIVDATTSMIAGGPWEGTPGVTNMIIASGDRVAADAIGLGLIKTFGKWEPVVSKDVWEQTQLKTALSLGIGKPKKEITFLKGEGDEAFDSLVDKIREHTGL
ncbi:hypothetical protein BAC1_00888 [uncultured bacterium]|nr:hypothetical protein BAC1_00888 [uncultured bacterium]